MLGKLLKYEYKATMRTFIPIYIALLLVALVNRIFRIGNIEIGFGISAFGLVLLFMALGVITIMVIIQRFNGNLLGDEGYLMFTLPVNSSSLIISKIIMSIVWTICSGIVAFMTFLVLVGTKEDILDFISNIDVIWAKMVVDFTVNGEQVNPISTILFIVVIMLFMYIMFILKIYLSLAIAQLPAVCKHRGIIAFAAFFVINTITTILTSILGQIIPEHCFQSFIGGAIAINGYLVILCMIYFIGTKFILDKHLNLE